MHFVTTLLIIKRSGTVNAPAGGAVQTSCAASFHGTGTETSDVFILLGKDVHETFHGDNTERIELNSVHRKAPSSIRVQEGQRVMDTRVPTRQKACFTSSSILACSVLGHELTSFFTKDRGAVVLAGPSPTHVPILCVCPVRGTPLPPPTQTKPSR